MKVEYAMGIHVRDMDNVSFTVVLSTYLFEGQRNNTNIPEASFLIRHQTNFWIADGLRLAKAQGIMVLTSVQNSTSKALELTPVS
jgi:hypothetical protein